MDPTYHWDITQGTPEWDAIRRGVITASAMKVLVTPTGKPANNDTSRGYLAELMVQRISSIADPGYYSKDMERGDFLEPFAREFYHHNIAPVTECGFIQRHYKGFTIGFSPDGLVGDDGLIEIKCRLAKHHVSSILKNEAPAEHVIQIQTGLLVTGREWVDFISYTPGLPFFRYRVQRDVEVIKSIESAAFAAEENIAKMLEDYRQKTATMINTEPLDLASIEPEDDIQF
jgi:predicted phage-related endonuclease